MRNANMRRSRNLTVLVFLLEFLLLMFWSPDVQVLALPSLKHREAVNSYVMEGFKCSTPPSNQLTGVTSASAELAGGCPAVLAPRGTSLFPLIAISLGPEIPNLYLPYRAPISTSHGHCPPVVGQYMQGPCAFGLALMSFMTYSETEERQ